MGHGTPSPPPRPSRARAFIFPADPGLLGAAVDRLMDACGRHAPPGSRARLALRVAVGEALANAVLHGNGGDPDRRVAVEVVADGRGVEVTVEDEGDGFDPDAVEDPTDPSARERTHGRGVFLVRRLADTARWDRDGRRVTLTVRP